MTDQRAARAEEVAFTEALAEVIKRIIDGGCEHDREKACRPCVVSRGVKHLRRLLAAEVQRAVDEAEAYSHHGRAIPQSARVGEPMKFKVEMFNPKARHIVCFRLNAIDAEMAARLAKLAIIRKRSSALIGKAADYRVEYVNRIAR